MKRAALSAASVGLAVSGVGATQMLGANEEIRVGVISTGNEGRIVMSDFLEHPDVEIASVCDVYRPNLDQGLKATDGTARGYKDFCEVLDRKDIDAVLIAAPDHWHALQMVLAFQAGKEVYVEKPTANPIEESKRMVEAARKYNRVVQVGTELRSNTYFQKAVQLVQEGLIGKVSFVRTWNYLDIFPRGFHHLPAHGLVPAGRGFAGSIHFARIHYSGPTRGSSMRINCDRASVN